MTNLRSSTNHLLPTYCEVSTFYIALSYILSSVVLFKNVMNCIYLYEGTQFIVLSLSRLVNSTVYFKNEENTKTNISLCQITIYSNVKVFSLVT